MEHVSVCRLRGPPGPHIPPVYPPVLGHKKARRKHGYHTIIGIKNKLLFNNSLPLQVLTDLSVDKDNIHNVWAAANYFPRDVGTRTISFEINLGC